MPSTVVPRGCSNFKLRQLSHRIDRRYADVMAAAGLSTSQYALLGHIEAGGPVRPADLALRMGLDRSTLTRNLQGLVAAGWVAVGPGADGRSRQVALTEAGRAQRQTARRAWKTAQEALNAALGPEQVVALHAMVDACMASLDRAEAHDGDAGAAPLAAGS